MGDKMQLDILAATLLRALKIGNTIGIDFIKGKIKLSFKSLLMGNFKWRYKAFEQLDANQNNFGEELPGVARKDYIDWNVTRVA